MARSLPYVAVLGVATLCYVALGVVLPVLPGYVTDDLGAGTVAVGLAIGAVSISGVVLRPIGGLVADRRGARPVVVAGALACATLVAGAGLALLGASGTLGGVPEDERGAASGTFFAFFDIGVGAGGPLLVAALAGAGGAVVAGAFATAAACAVLAPARRPA